MSRREMFHAVKGALIHVYVYLFFLAATGFLAVKDFQMIWIFAAAGFLFVTALLAKWRLICDLAAGQTKTFYGQIAFREIAGNLRCVHTEYLVEKAENAPRKFVLFPDTLPLSLLDRRGILSCPVIFHYLPRSLVIVKIEQTGPQLPKKEPRHRTKAWYQEKGRTEYELREVAQPKWCKFWENYWFWEGFSLFAMGIFSGLCIILWGRI